MERWKALLEELPAGPNALLTKLRELAAAGVTGLPAVTLHLRSGRDVSGVVLDRKEERGEGSWVLEAQTHDRFADDLVLVPTAQVEAVTLHDASRLGQILEQRRPAPSPLELQRIARDSGQALGTAVGKTLTFEVALEGQKFEGDAARAVRLWIERVTRVLTETATSDLGKEALAALNKVRLEPGGELAVRRQDDALVFAGRLASTPAQVPDESELKRAAEDAL